MLSLMVHCIDCRLASKRTVTLSDGTKAPIPERVGIYYKSSQRFVEGTYDLDAQDFLTELDPSLLHPADCPCDQCRPVT